MDCPIVLRTRSGDEVRARQLSLAEMASVIEVVWQRERASLLEDLDAVDADHATKVEAIAALREKRGLASYLLTQVFRLPSAIEVLSRVMEPEKVKALDSATAVDLALRCIGYDPDEEDEGASPPEAPSQPSSN